MDYILSDEELLYVLKHGVWAKLTEDDHEWIHYNVLDFTGKDLLVCYSGIDWITGETWHKPHIIYQEDKNKNWFMEKPEKE